MISWSAAASGSCLGDGIFIVSVHTVLFCYRSAFMDIGHEPAFLCTLVIKIVAFFPVFSCYGSILLAKLATCWLISIYVCSVTYCVLWLTNIMARFTQSAQSMLTWATSHVLDEGYTGGTVWQMITTTSGGLGLSECKCYVYTTNQTWLILGVFHFIVNVCFYRVKFNFFSTMRKEWLKECLQNDLFLCWVEYKPWLIKVISYD